MENKHTAYDLAQMQSLPLDLKITMTKRRIREWYEHWDGNFGAHLEKSPNRFERLKQTHPQLWEYCMKPWEEGGLGLKVVCDFVGIKTGYKERE